MPARSQIPGVPLLSPSRAPVAPYAPVLAPLRSGALAATLFAVLACGSVTTSPPPASAFVLDIRYLGTAPTGATLQSFEDAANTVRQTITGALSTVAVPNDFTNLSQCGSEYGGHPDVPRDNITGLVIYVSVQPIDGIGGTLASAGPCLVRSQSDNYLPALGVMRFDEADVASLLTQGVLTRVVLHEMLHVLGFGTIWPDQGLLDSTDLADARFLGPRARAACADVNGGGTACSTTVPVHSTGGAGTRYTHWRESMFTNELMTPFLNAGSNPFSAMSVQSLGDLGFEVSTSAAEPFTASGSELRAALLADGTPIAFGEPTRPRYIVTRSGALIPYDLR